MFSKIKPKGFTRIASSLTAFALTFALLTGFIYAKPFEANAQQGGSPVITGVSGTSASINRAIINFNGTGYSVNANKSITLYFETGATYTHTTTAAVAYSASANSYTINHTGIAPPSYALQRPPQFVYASVVAVYIEPGFFADASGNPLDSLGTAPYVIPTVQGPINVNYGPITVDIIFASGTSGFGTTPGEVITIWDTSGNVYTYTNSSLPMNVEYNARHRSFIISVPDIRPLIFYPAQNETYSMYIPPNFFVDVNGNGLGSFGTTPYVPPTNPPVVQPQVQGPPNFDYNQGTGEVVIGFAPGTNGFGVNAGETVTIYDSAGNASTFTPSATPYSSGANSIVAPATAFSPAFAFNPSETYTVYISPGLLTNSTGATLGNLGSTPYTPPTNPPTNPPTTPTVVTDNYYQRHYDTWLNVFTAINEMPNGGTMRLTVPTSIDHVQHFVLDALVGTNKTLIIERGGWTYTISGRNMRDIVPGHNQLFVGNLDAFVTART